MAGDIGSSKHCRAIVDKALAELGGIDILVNNAASEMSSTDLKVAWCVRANAVAPGPIWTPLIPSTMSEDTVEEFGKNVPMKRPGQPAELATAYVMLADPLSSYVSGATIAVTGGKPIL
jgi:NAD(P)-dependent dehydrogenase (short-subunit alcohol dehydrogenase family)